MTSRRGGPRDGAGRPRIEADRAILSAARTLLRSGGFGSLTVDEVARRASVSPGTVYRRWPSKTALAAAAYADTIGPPDPVNTGSLRGDLAALSPYLFEFFAGEHGRLLASLCGALDNAELRQTIAEVTNHRRLGIARIFERAAARAELRAGVDVDLAIDVMLGPLWTRLLVTRSRITRAVVGRVLELTEAAVSRQP
jgi:AcrR family transcriptional regulator